MSEHAPSFLDDRKLKLVFFGGKGGVGKTTCACAAALRMAGADRDAAFLLVSTDPAHSLLDSLAGSSPPENLEVAELDAGQCLADFKARHSAVMKTIATRGTFLDGGDIDRMLDLSLPGLDELMAAIKIIEWAQSGKYARIVVDTAPTGHTLQLLALPAVLRKWLDAVDALLAKHRYMRTMFRRGANERDETDEFVDELTKSVNGLDALFRDREKCRFVPVMLAEEMSFHETRGMLKELSRAGLSVADVVVNRVVPASECPVCAEVRKRQMDVLEKIRRSRSFSNLSVWTLPLFGDEVRGVARLAELWAEARPADEEKSQASPAVTAIPIRVENPMQTTPCDKSLILFAGKGGVGKTTMSCATALRLAADMPDMPILLFSTDPAHALPSCLDVKLGKNPAGIFNRLDALQIDSGKEFSTLKKLYAEELRAMLRSALPQMDVAFDGEAMEKMLDLAPPGLDEVMALLKVLDLREAGAYRTIVLDTAPTGHLLRFLEMPALIDGWLKVFFGILLKYPSLFRLPRVTQKLIDMSKALRRLRAMLADPMQTALFCVAIPTEMACAETHDLVEACRRMQVPVSALFVNLATPSDGSCALCDAVRRREETTIRRYDELFPEITRTKIFRDGDLRGVEKLRMLGDSLYARHREG